MSFELAPLPYDYSALEPHIDTQTMQIHHGKHHQAYVTNLNKRCGRHRVGGQEHRRDLANLERRAGEHPQAVRNNGGGHANHSCSGRSWARQGRASREGARPTAINANWGSFESSRPSSRRWAWPLWQRLGVAGGQADGSSTPTACPTKTAH